MDAQKIIFYGPLGKNNSFTVGGGEAGNYKTIQLLEKNGIEVKKVFKPYPHKGLFGYVSYAFRMLFKVFVLAREIISSRKVETVHISGFYQHLIYQEYLLILVSRILKIKCIYELRGGGVTEAYNNSSFFYRAFFRGAINKASVILCQGKKYLPFIKSLTHVEVIHYPNFVLNAFCDFSHKENREHDSVLQLIYFGRIVASKNVGFIVDVCRELDNLGVRFEMEIIGSGDDNYIGGILSSIRKNNLEANIKILQPMQSNALRNKLVTKHFFLFPSREKREGHSNALTEAMAMGVVPVCSNAGFNREIAGTDRLVIENLNARAYADVVKEIWSNGEWKDLSQKVSERIKNHYTEKAAEEILLNVYNIKNKQN